MRGASSFFEVSFDISARAHLRERGFGIYAVRARDKPRNHIILPPTPPFATLWGVFKKDGGRATWGAGA